MNIHTILLGSPLGGIDDLTYTFHIDTKHNICNNDCYNSINVMLCYVK